MEKPISIVQPEATVPLLSALLEYLKLVSKEARADRRVLHADEKLELEAKAAKLDLEKAKIDQMKEEAAERFDRTMSVAHAALVTGIVHAQQPAAGGDWTISIPRETAERRKSDLIQIQINHQEEEIEKAAKRVAESRDAYEASLARKTAAADNIQKLLDIIRAMNPQI